MITVMIIHQAYSEYPNNTYMGIGSSLNPFIRNGFKEYINE